MIPGTVGARHPRQNPTKRFAAPSVVDWNTQS